MGQVGFRVSGLGFGSCRGAQGYGYGFEVSGFGV